MYSKSFISALMLTINLLVSAQGEWYQISPWPTINDLFDVYFINDQKGWLVGSKGTIVSTSDGGETWDIQYKDNSKYFKGVFFIDENEGWVIGWHDVLHTTNGGNYWEEQDLPGFLDTEAISFINSDTGWIVGTYKTIYKTTDGGATWMLKLNGTPSSPMLNDVFFSDALHGVAIGGFWFTPDEEAYTIVTADGGETWQETSPAGIRELISISFISADNGWACGRGSEVLKTSNGGYTWNVISEVDDFMDDIYFLDQNNGRILQYNSVFSTIDGGINWSENYIPGASSLNAFSFSGSAGFTCGFYGEIYRSEDAGISWEHVGSEPFNDVENVYFSDSLNGWAMNIPGFGLSKTENGGLNWQQIDIGSSEIFTDLFFLNPSTGYALGAYDSVFKTNDAGQTWNKKAIGVEGTFTSIYFINEQKGFIGGNYGTLLKTIDGGLQWDEVYLTSYGTFNDIDFADELHGWAINSSVTVYRTIDGGETWTPHGLGNSGLLDDILMFNDQRGLIATLEGKIYLTLNGGDTWEVVFDVLTGFANRARMAFVDENEGWFLIGSNLYYSLDGGASWNYYNSFSYLEDICFFDNHGWIFGSHSLLLKYKDFTTEIQDQEPVKLTIFPNPVSDFLTLQLPFSMGEHDIINVFDINGKLIMNRQARTNSTTIQMDVSFLPDGIYLLEYRNSNQHQTIKLIKHK